MFQVDPQANHVVNLDKSPEWPWARYFSLSDFLLGLAKKNYCQGKKAQNQECLIIHLRHHVPQFPPAKKLVVKVSGPWGPRVSNGSLFRALPPVELRNAPWQNVKWVMFEFFEIHPASDAPRTLNWGISLVILLSDITRYMLTYIKRILCTYE